MHVIVERFALPAALVAVCLAGPAPALALQNPPGGTTAPAAPESAADALLRQLANDRYQALARFDNAQQKCDKAGMQAALDELRQQYRDTDAMYQAASAAGSLSTLNPEQVRTLRTRLDGARAALDYATAETNKPCPPPADTPRPPAASVTPPSTAPAPAPGTTSAPGTSPAAGATPATGTAPPAPPPPPEQPQERLSRESAIAEVRLTLARLDCNAARMAEARAELDRTARELRQMLEAARAAGAFTTLSPDQIADLEKRANAATERVTRADEAIRNARCTPPRERGPQTSVAPPPSDIAPPPPAPPPTADAGVRIPGRNRVGLEFRDPGPTDSGVSLSPRMRLSFDADVRDVSPPNTGIGFQRAGPPGAAPERFAGELNGKEHAFGFGISAQYSFGDFALLGRIRYSESDRASLFAIPTTVNSGVVYGALSPSGSSGIATPFGLNGGVQAQDSDLTFSTDLRIDLSTSLTTDGGLTFGGRVRLQYDNTDTDVRGNAGFTDPSFSFSQTRDQDLTEQRFGLGIALDANYKKSDFFISAELSAILQYRDANLNSIERNSCNFCPAADRNFTHSILDDLDGWTGEFGARIQAGFDLGGATIGASVDVRHQRDAATIFNPNSGDQVFFERRRTGIQTYDRTEFSAGVFIGFSF